MKDAMGELNMTVVTIVAIGAVAAFFMGVLWPSIKDSITSGWQGTCTQYDEEGNCTQFNSNTNTGIIIIPDLYK